MKCPVCKSQNIPGVIECTQCGSDLYTVLLEQVSTTQLNRNRRLITDRLTMPSSKPVVVYIRNANEPLAIPRTGKVMLGRTEDNSMSATPDITLNNYNAEDLGVSRLHAALDTSVSPPTITDLDSFNGSFINGQQLMPHQTYTLQSGDEIRLGRMVLRVFYNI